MKTGGFVFFVVLCNFCSTLPFSHAGEPRFSFVPVPKQNTVSFTPDEEKEKQTPELFRLKKTEFSVRAEKIQESGNLRVHKVTFPSPIVTDVESNNTVHAEYFQPAGEGPFPGVIVLHILGGEFHLSQTIASAMAHEGVACLFIKMPYYGERRSKQSPRRMVSREPTETVEGFRQAILDIRCGLSWLADRPEVSDEDLGVTGISLGGIVTSLVASADPRLENVAIYLAGGNLPELVWSIPDREAVEFRKNWIERGESRESFLKILKPIDPASHGHLLKEKRVVMVSARRDEIFSESSTLSLKNAIGERVELVWLEEATHYSAAFYLPSEIKRLQRFFLKRPEPKTP